MAGAGLQSIADTCFRIQCSELRNTFNEMARITVSPLPTFNTPLRVQTFCIRGRPDKPAPEPPQAPIPHSQSLTLPCPSGRWNLQAEGMLGGSWVVISGVLSKVTVLITPTRGLITPLITTHEPPSKTQHLGRRGPKDWDSGLHQSFGIR